MNKYLVTLMVPTIQMEFSVYIPNNKKIGTVKRYILKSLNELSNYNFSGGLNDTLFIDRDTGKIYENNILIKDSGIKNGVKIIVI